MAKKTPPKAKLSVVGSGGGGNEPPNLGGAPVKADEDRLKTIVATLRLGAHFDIACYMAELDPKSVKNYLIQAREEPNSIYGKFLREITKALSEAEVRDLGVIDMAAQGRPAQYLMVPDKDRDGNPIYDDRGRLQMVAQLDGEGKPIKIKNETFPSWQAAAWKLERKAPKRWGRYDRIAIDDIEGFTKEQRNKSEEEKIDAGEVEARAKRLKRVKTVLEAIPEETDLGDV